ncbi:MAG: hypothetical protein LBT46_05440 [Planctomycetaceae bacterium]|nr:hypothetical protein [Planctomycetaceae bacterium]
MSVQHFPNIDVFINMGRLQGDGIGLVEAFLRQKQQAVWIKQAVCCY